MDLLHCEIMTVIEGEEKTVGHINVHSAPREGECIWFSQNRLGHSSWTVNEVCHWVGSGELGIGYQKVAVYAEPTIK
ncbi:hypothetical protein [Halobacillus litoralis]|uniref:hypothetical protein n=1 Tax=Halobacillus litoralis TaxID=45668 RepID=UPI001CD3DD81|nr:hypothetical protein [Halobacillus litoralis]MCA1021577.1 hypothetical protein [Halobacillus litoralis]